MIEKKTSIVLNFTLYTNIYMYNFVYKTMPKDRMMSLRLPEILIDEYKKFCEENSFTMSKRLRKLMESDLERWRKYKYDQKKAEPKNTE
jgi:hypothetical protein